MGGGGGVCLAMVQFIYKHELQVGVVGGASVCLFVIVGGEVWVRKGSREGGSGEKGGAWSGGA